MRGLKSFLSPPGVCLPVCFQKIAMLGDCPGMSGREEGWGGKMCAPLEMTGINKLRCILTSIGVWAISYCQSNNTLLLRKTFSARRFCHFVGLHL